MLKYSKSSDASISPDASTSPDVSKSKKRTVIWPTITIIIIGIIVVIIV